MSVPSVINSKFNLIYPNQRMSILNARWTSIHTNLGSVLSVINWKLSLITGQVISPLQWVKHTTYHKRSIRNDGPEIGKIIMYVKIPVEISSDGNMDSLKLLNGANERREKLDVTEVTIDITSVILHILSVVSCIIICLSWADGLISDSDCRWM